MDGALCEIKKRSAEAVQTSKNLMSAPEACYMMEALTIFSSCIKLDPSLKSGDPAEKFEHLHRPNSLKASLYQVANAMSQTFQTAHDSVTTIANSLEDVPTLMNDCLDAMEIIDEPGSQDVIDYALETLNFSAGKCVTAAVEVDDECTKALLIINELCEAATATDGRNKEEVQKTKDYIENQTLLKKQQEALVKKLEIDLTEQKCVVDEAMSDYNARMADANNFSSIVGAMLLDNLSGIVHTVTSSATSIVQAVASLPPGAFTAFTTLKDIRISSYKKDELLTLAMESVLCELIENIISFDEDSLKADAEMHISTLKCACEYKVSTESAKMLQDTGESLINALKYAQKHTDCDQKIKGAKAAAENNLKAYKKATESDNKAIDEKQKTQTALSQERQTIMQMRLANSQTAKDHYENEKKVLGEYRKQLAAANDKLNEVVLNLQTLDVKNANLEQILEYLQQGITQLVGVQSAWRQIVAFFRSIKATVNGPLCSAIRGTTTNVKKITDKEMKSVNQLQRKILLREINKACAVAYVLMESAALYKQISIKYIMPILDSSCRNIVMSDEEAQQKQYSIVNGFKKIKNEVTKDLDIFENKLKSKLAPQIENRGFLNKLSIKDN